MRAWDDSLMKLLLSLAAGSLAACSAAAEPAPTTAELRQMLDDELIELQREAGYVWHETDGGRSVQYGVPETDDRAFRLDCSEGRLFVIAYGGGGDEGAPVTATFSNGDKRAGQLEELGDGANFVVALDPDDPVVATLLEDRIAIDTEQTIVRVPGAGGVPLLRALIDRCRTGGP